ncbi:MAG TPA: gluconolaconase, partial [Rhodobiaceae bacterium]|nr:gluconolaconase [Rhodobiaceae bacterium]
GGPNGAAIGPDGACYVCNDGGFEFHEVDGALVPGDAPADYSGGRIERVDLKTGEFKVLYKECNGIPLNGPNDIVFDSQGGFWFTDLGKGRGRTQDRGGLYYAKIDGSMIKEVVFPITTPNGVGLSPDEKTVYVSDTIP